MSFTKEQIYKALDLLNIPTNNQINGNWLGISCPLHVEKTPYGSCSVDLDSGGINCFSCKGHSSIIDLIEKKFNIETKEAFKLIDVHSSSGTQSRRSNCKKENKSNIPKSLPNGSHDFTEIDFDPENYFYTKQRGFTKEFNKEFNITRALSGIYNDYMIIPCIDSEKNIVEFEARRLLEYEYQNKLFNIMRGDYSRLKKNFNQYIKKNNIRIENYIVMQGNEIIDNPTLKYLLQPKVRYVFNSQLYRTLWNIDNLKFDEELYLTEGTGSLPKINTHITKNCSCTFGSKIDKEQIEILKKFKKIIITPDNDLAGHQMIKDLYLQLKNFTIKKIKSEDIDLDYIEEIKNTREIKPNQFLSKTIFFKGRK